MTRRMMTYYLKNSVPIKILGCKVPFLYRPIVILLKHFKLFLGGFDLQNDSAAADIIDQALTMLSQYLVSNQALELNSTFKVYLKVMSIQHMEARNPVRRAPKKRNFRTRMHVGGESHHNYSAKWAFECDFKKFSITQQEEMNNKCLLISFIFALLKHFFFNQMVVMIDTLLCAV